MAPPTEFSRFMVAMGIATVIVLGGWGALRVAGWAWERFGSGTPDGPPQPPADAVDPLNPPVWIEGGTFVSGSDRPQAQLEPEHPYSTADEIQRGWEVEGFWIQQHEVTNEEYRRFDPDHVVPPGRERHPVTNVTFREAMGYALWRGGRLPTDVEWEFAARGPESWTYPWGNEEPSCEQAHFRECDPREPVPVMSRPAGASPAGVHDLAGNVWEWVMPTWHEAGRTPINQDSRRMRGGSFMEEPFFLRGAKRSENILAGFESPSTGFRVAWSAE